jgi:hypothetical protein
MTYLLLFTNPEYFYEEGDRDKKGREIGIRPI